MLIITLDDTIILMNGATLDGCPDFIIMMLYNGRR